ncbi:MAG: SUMF1/EgtB/PvdO family nonheme iron enzyme, partial [Gammaproteobacteria bacterium]|nr:SUMF1/EgtB/PvdO family nonheme iron enzyme [Gammaproteobacteria bacterium]
MFRLKLIRSIGLALAAILVSIVYSATQIVYAGEYNNFLGMKFVSVPAGSFKMGSATEKLGVKFDEMPQHEVSVAAFQIMTTEVTLA